MRAPLPNLRLRIPREGWFWLLLSANLFIIGWGRGINLVVPLSYLMGLIFLLNLVLALPGLRGLRGVRRLPDAIFAEEPFLLSVAVANLARRPRIGIQVEDVGAEHKAAWFLVSQGSGEVSQLTRELTLPQRGRYRWGPLSAASGYPFGLVRWQTTLVPEEAIIVLPRLGRLHRGRLRRFLTLDTPREDRFRPSGRPSAAARSEFHGLRPMRIGDSPRWIHWRTSARRGEMMVREFESVVADDLLLVVEPPEDPALLEEVISLAATLCWEWCRQRGDKLTLVVLGLETVVCKGTTGPDLARRTLESLAVVPPGTAASEDGLPRKIPAGPVLVIGAGDSALREALAVRLRRPMAWLDAARLDDCDFYERPPHEP